ncbi:hypothetical protein [Nocardioides sp.]|uniref:hypothetical protein n=1 Tax=Nocardioides sp. TaxID=35761 RepID=UPI003783652A
MTPLGRWSVVALGVLLVVGTPVAVAAWPTPDSDVSAAELLAEVTAAEDHPWSGYVETQGSLQLPVQDDFADVGALLSGHTRLRVWWRSADDWRVDQLETAGESDLVHQDPYTTEWSYEAERARVSRDPDIRLPRTADLLPPVLAARVLDDVDARDVSRLPAQRVAGVAAPGLRVRPAQPQSSIDHVDLWADPDSGVALRVEVYGAGSGAAAFTTEMRDFSAATPAASRTAFEPPVGTHVSYDDVLDIADAANQYAPLRPPDRVGGLAMASASQGAVGVYGAGLAQLIAIPLRHQEADPLREQLGNSPDAAQVDEGVLVAAGPLGVLVTGQDGDGGWLVTGTVTAATLRAAARDLVAHTTYYEDDE